MKNAEIAKLLYEIANILEMMGVDWKPNAFRKAARNLENLSDDVQELYNKDGLNGLKNITGVGDAIANKIVEYLKKGKIEELEALKKKIPAGVEEFLNIPSLGPKKAWRLYNELKLKNIKDLEKFAKSGKISKLEGFGEKSEEDILVGIALVKEGKERRLLGVVLPLARNIVKKLKQLDYVKQVEIAGSLRRRKETIGDIDILVTSSKPTRVLGRFIKMNEVFRVNAKGKTRAAVVLDNGMNCDLRVVDSKSYGSALLYFTGNKEHNVEMRKIAIKKKWKLNEYGLFDKNNKKIAGKNEEEIYDKLGLKYVEPEMRENLGELKIGKKMNLLPYNSIKGDLHMHTVWSDGHYNTEDMVNAAKKFGYEYIAITDHSKSTHIANGLDEKRLMKHLDEIDKIARKHKDIEIFKGAEVDILKDGRLDYSNEILAKLDVVIASVHSRFKLGKEDMTMRIIKAINNKNVNIIGHLTGRLINQREAYDVDIGKIINACVQNNVALEVNSFPSRLDIKDIHIREAIENKAKIVINTDSHDISHLKFMEFGIAQARRGWATTKDVINAWQLHRFKKYIEK